MIDYVEELEPGKFANGYKDLLKDEWFFKVHWPKDPNMPGMLQIESLVQMSAMSILTLPGNMKVMYLASATNLKFIKVVPETRLNIKTKISYKKGLAIVKPRAYK